MTQREHDTLMAIMHHVSCYNDRQVTAVRIERLKVTIVGGDALPMDLVIEDVHFAPTPRKSA